VNGDVHRVDVEGDEVLERAVAEDVPPEPGHDRDPSAEVGGHHRLIRSLASVSHTEVAPVQRLSDARQAWHVADQVDERGADDADGRLVAVVVSLRGHECYRRMCSCV
jgi:hypothetical protein